MVASRDDSRFALVLTPCPHVEPVSYLVGQSLRSRDLKARTEGVDGSLRRRPVIHQRGDEEMKRSMWNMLLMH